MNVLFICKDASDVEPFAIGLRLRWQDMVSSLATDRESVSLLAGRGSADLVIICGDEPGMTIDAAIRSVRSVSEAPMIVMIERDSEMAIISAIELGADDVVGLPCSPMILIARAVALLRRVGGATRVEPSASLRLGALVIDPVTYEAHLHGKPLRLTPTEFRLLHLFAQNEHLTLSQDMIQRELWSDKGNATDTLKKYVQRLRRKLGDSAKDSEWIATVHGIGYRFNSPSTSRSLATAP